MFIVPSLIKYISAFWLTLTTILFELCKRKISLVMFIARRLMYCFSEEDIVQPDIIFVSNENQKDFTKDNIKGTPDLLIEILSPSTCKRDLGIKKKLYVKNGVREYWIVDLSRKSLKVLNLKEKVSFRVKVTIQVW